MREIIFLVEQTEGGDFTARTPDRTICTSAETFDELQSNVAIALLSHADAEAASCRIQFQYGYVRTSTLVGYFGAMCAWMLEIATILVHVLSGNSVPLVVQILLTSATFALSVLAWRRREDFRALRASRGRVPLRAGQALIVTSMVMGLSILGTVLIFASAILAR